MLERLWPSAAARDPGHLGPVAFVLRPAISDTLLLLARVLIGYIFALSGWGKLMGIAGFAAFLQKQGLPASYALAVLGGLVEFIGGLALILGVANRYIALLIVAFTFVATGVSHRFWELEGAARQAQTINFNKNMAIIGGLLALLVAGPGRFSLDALLARGRR